MLGPRFHFGCSTTREIAKLIARQAVRCSATAITLSTSNSADEFRLHLHKQHKCEKLEQVGGSADLVHASPIQLSGATSRNRYSDREAKFR